jgi:transposase
LYATGNESNKRRNYVQPKACQRRNITPVIPSKSNKLKPKQTDYALYKERNLVERFFNIIKHVRGIATRYDKLANTFLGAIHLIAAVVWLK